MIVCERVGSCESTLVWENLGTTEGIGRAFVPTALELEKTYVHCIAQGCWSWLVGWLVWTLLFFCKAGCGS